MQNVYFSTYLWKGKNVDVDKQFIMTVNISGRFRKKSKSSDFQLEIRVLLCNKYLVFEHSSRFMLKFQ